MKYRKRPLEVEAVYFDGTFESHERVKEFVGDAYDKLYEDVVLIRFEKLLFDRPAFYLHVGFWLIKGIEGEFYPCSDSVFQKSYEMVE